MSLPVEEPPPAVRFGRFELDTRAGELRKDGHRVKLQEKPFRMLELLLKRPGEVVTRDELRQRLWPADTFVDFDNGLNTAVNKVRSALGDAADSPLFVETLGRRGYRFIAQLESRPAAPPAAPVRVEVPHRRPRAVLTAVIALVLVAALSVLAVRRWPRPGSVPPIT